MCCKELNTLCMPTPYTIIPGLYLFREPSDQTVDPSVTFTIETNGISLTEWTIFVWPTIQIKCNIDDSRVVCFQW